MLQSNPVRDPADARSLKALRGELRKRGVQDNGPRFLRTLLLGPPQFCWAPLSRRILARNCTLHHMASRMAIALSERTFAGGAWQDGGVRCGFRLPVLNTHAVSVTV
jgi:hypothetical protein